MTALFTPTSFAALAIILIALFLESDFVDFISGLDLVLFDLHELFEFLKTTFFILLKLLHEL